MFSPLMVMILSTYPISTFSCLSTTPVSSPTVAPSTDPTTTACSPDLITYGQGDDSVPQTVLDVTYSEYTVDATSASMVVSCTAPTGNNPTMSLNNNVFPLENVGAGQTVSVALTCSIADNVWIYALLPSGPITVLSADCDILEVGK